MASEKTRVRLFAVDCLNGHGPWTDYFPAQSATQLMHEMDYPPDVKVAPPRQVDWVTFEVGLEAGTMFISNSQYNLLFWENTAQFEFVRQFSSYNKEIADIRQWMRDNPDRY